MVASKITHFNEITKKKSMLFLTCMNKKMLLCANFFSVMKKILILVAAGLGVYYLTKTVRSAKSLRFDPVGVNFEGFSITKPVLGAKINIVNTGQSTLKIKDIMGDVIDESNKVVATINYQPVSSLEIQKRDVTEVTLPIRLTTNAITLLLPLITNKTLPKLRFKGTVNMFNANIPIDEPLT